MNFPPILFNNEKFPSLFNQPHSQSSSSLLSFQVLCKKLLKYENKEVNFEQSIISWMKSLDISHLFKYFSFKNQWLVDILHELVLISNSKSYLKFKFIPSINSQSSSEEKEPQDTKPLLSYINFLFFNKESPKFSDYFNIVDEDMVMLTRGRTEIEQRRQELVDSIRYVTLNSEQNISEQYNNVVTLSYKYLTNIDNLITTFQMISNKNCFKNPIEIETRNYIVDNNNTTGSKNFYNFKMPKWLNKEFTFSELLCAYFEQCIIINFMYYKMYMEEISFLYFDKFDELIDNNKKLINFIKNRGEDKLEIVRNLRPDEIKKTISDNPKIKKLICDKKGKDDDIRNSYIGKYSYSKKHTIKTIINGCITTVEKIFLRGEVDFVLFLNFIKDNVIFTTEDFAIKAISDIVNNYWKSKEAEELLNEIDKDNKNNSNNGTNKKKRRKKKKKKDKNEDENNNNINDNNNNINDKIEDNKENNKNTDVNIINEDNKIKNNDKNNINKNINVIIDEEKDNNENKVEESKIEENQTEENKIEENKIEENKIEEKNLDNNIKEIIKEENNDENNIIKDPNQTNNIEDNNTPEKETNNINEISDTNITKETEQKDIYNINDNNINENSNIIPETEKSHKTKKEKDFFLYPTVKEGNKKKKNKQKNKKNSTLNDNINNEEKNEKNQNIEIIILNQEEDKAEILSDKGTTSTKEEENKEEIIKEEIKEEIVNDIINNNEENKKYKKKNKSEYEHSSSWQKNKFNMGLKIKKIKKENANIIIPKKYNQQEWSHKHQRYNNNKEEIIEIEENNYIIGSNMPQFTSFYFQSKKRKNYRNKNNIFFYNNFSPNSIIQLSKEIIDNTIKVNNNKKILQQIREKYIKKIYENINIILRNSKVEFQCAFYGSSISGLSIENSDVDIMVKLRKNSEEKDYINKIMNIIVENLKKNGLNYVKNIIPIASASVPVIKLDCDLCNEPSFFDEINSVIKNYNINYNDISKLFFDITFFETENEINKIPSELMIDYIKKCTLIYPQIFDIVYIMKRFLFHRKLNKSYQGGISSYSLFLITLAFIKSFKTNYEIPIGSLFIEYLYFYSNFDFYNTVIQPNKEKNIFENIEENNLEKCNLNIIDPITGLNVAKSTFKIDQIQKAFREGFDIICNNLFEMNLINMGIQEHTKILDNFFFVK